MKTLQQIEKLILDDRAEAERLTKEFNSASEEEKDKTRKRLKRLRTFIEYHEEIKRYLITNPSREFLEKEEERIKGRLAKISDGYKIWCDLNKKPFKDEASRLAFYQKENDVPELKRWLKNTMFILN